MYVNLLDYFMAKDNEKNQLKQYLNSALMILLCITSIHALAGNDDEFKGSYICFKTSLIKVNVHYERTPWPDSSLTDVCSLSLTINATKPSYYYYSRGWRYPDLCRKFMSDWDGLKKENKKVCIAARLDLSEKVQKSGKTFLERSAPYEIIKSGSWCHSYFDGYCN